MVAAICLVGCLDIVCIVVAQMTARHKMTTTKTTTDRVALLKFQAQMADLARKVGARIRELREERKAQDPRWTQDYLARSIEDHINGTQMSRYERGEVMPEQERLEKIAAVLNTTVADLYAGPEAEREQPEGDLMESLAAAQGQAELPLPVADALDALRAEMGEKMDALHSELEEMKQLLASSGRTAKRNRS